MPTSNDVRVLTGAAEVVKVTFRTFGGHNSTATSSASSDREERNSFNAILSNGKHKISVYTVFRCNQILEVYYYALICYDGCISLTLL